MFGCEIRKIWRNLTSYSKATSHTVQGCLHAEWIVVCKQTKILCRQLNCLVKLADVLVVLRVKVKRGTKMLVLNRHGYCACTPMRFDAEAVAPALLTLVRLPRPLASLSSRSISLVTHTPILIKPTISWGLLVESKGSRTHREDPR